MTRYDRLRVSALESCRFGGHDMKKFKRVEAYCEVFRSECKICGKYVYIDLNPLPNGIDIGGTAVALNCKRLEGEKDGE